MEVVHCCSVVMGVAQEYCSKRTFYTESYEIFMWLDYMNYVVCLPFLSPQSTKDVNRI